MVHLIFGNDEYGVSEAVNALLDRLCGSPDHEGVSTFDGAATPWIKLREACGTLSLFAQQQIILVRGLLGAWSGKAEAAAPAKGGSKPNAAEFARFVSELPDATVLILQEADLSPTNRYAKELGSLPNDAVHSMACAMPKDPAARETWFAQHLRGMIEARGGSIDNRTVRLLAQRCGQDLRQASHEVDKLLAYTAPLYSIVQDDVLALTTEAVETKVYDLADAVAAKQVTRVVDLVDRLLAAGQAPEQLVALVSGRIHDLSLLAGARAERVPFEAVAARAGWQPWRLRQLEHALSGYDRAGLAAAQGMLVATDLALKSRPSHQRPLIVLLSLLAITQRTDGVSLCAALAY